MVFHQLDETSNREETIWGKYFNNLNLLSFKKTLFIQYATLPEDILHISSAIIMDKSSYEEKLG